MPLQNSLLLNIAWTIVGILKYASLAIDLAGVAIFGWYFVGAHGRAAEGETDAVPGASWRGPGALLGAKVLATGILLQIASFIIVAVLPARL